MLYRVKVKHECIELTLCALSYRAYSIYFGLKIVENRN